MVRNLEEFNGRYRGQIAFIVGAGTSLRSQDPYKLKDYVVFTVNSSILWCNWSDFWVSDDQSVRFWDFFYQDLKYSKTTVLLYEDKLKNQAELFGNRSVLFRHRTKYHFTKKYSHTDKKNHIGQSRTSLGSAIMVCYIMGFSRVCLLGVDGCRYAGKRYFWQFDGFDKPTRSDTRNVDNYSKVKKGSLETDTDLVNIGPYWKKLAYNIPNNFEVYNASPRTEIDVFPKIQLDQFLSQYPGSK